MLIIEWASKYRKKERCNKDQYLTYYMMQKGANCILPRVNDAKGVNCILQITWCNRVINILQIPWYDRVYSISQLAWYSRVDSFLQSTWYNTVDSILTDYHIFWETICHDNPKSAYAISSSLPTGYQPARMITLSDAFWTERGIMPGTRLWPLDDVRNKQVAWRNAKLPMFYLHFCTSNALKQWIGMCDKQIISRGFGYHPQLKLLGW